MMEDQAALEYLDDGEGQEGPFPRRPLSLREKPPPPLPMSTRRGQMEYILFENIPNGVTMSDHDGSSIQSLPNVPSPLSGPTPSIMSENHENDHHHRQHSFPRSRRREREEEDTFFDDRSLELRIQRTLGQAPRPMHLETPSSVPVTPNGPSTARYRNNNSANHSKQSRQTPTTHRWNIPDPTSDAKLRSHRSDMAMTKLKIDLRDAKSHQELLEQENRAARDELGKLERKCELAQERADNCEKERVASEKATEEIRYELQARKSEQQKVVAERNAMEMEVQQLRQEVETLKGENQAMSARTRSMLRNHREDIADLNAKTDSKIERLRSELNSAFKEVEALKTSLDQANNKTNAKETELEEIKAEKLAEVSEISQKHEAYRKETGKLNEALLEADKQSTQHLQNLQTREEEFKAIREADQAEIVRLRNALKESSKGDTVGIEVSALKEANALQQQKIEEMLQEMEETTADNQTHTEEIQRLGAALEEAQKLSNQSSLNAAEAGSLKHVSSQTNKSGPFSIVPPTNTAYSGGGVGDSIADRLVRIRDAAERASLVKDHQREVARMKALHESKIRALNARHEQKLEDTVASTKSKLNQKHNNALEGLKMELEARIATMEKRHREEADRLQEEHKESAKNSKESLAVALSKVNAGKHRIEREVAKREQLQEALNQLEEQLLTEKQQLLDAHAGEVLALRTSWDDEKDTLLDLIQRDCNQVFEKQRTSAGIQVSPKSVEFDFSTLDRTSSLGVDAKQNQKAGASPPPKELNPGLKLDSSSYSKIDEELRETEALVQSLLFGHTSED